MTTTPLTKTTLSSSHKEILPPEEKGKLQGKQVTKVDQAPSKLKILFHRIIAIALIAIGTAALIFGISVLASGTLFTLGAASARFIGLFIAALGCSGILRGISVMEEISTKSTKSTKSAKPEKKADETPVAKTPKKESDPQNWVNFVGKLKQMIRGVYNFEKKDLVEIHQDFFLQTDAKALFLADNRIETIQDEIGNLVELQRLDVSKNKLKNLPKTLSKLAKLEELSASGNSLESLPEEIGNLSQLKALRVSNNKLLYFPDSISKLSNLESLIAANNRLRGLPEAIGGLKKLVKLDLEKNDLSELPESMNDLVDLRDLNLRSNKLSSVWLGALPDLNNLDLSDNQLIRFPGLYNPQAKKDRRYVHSPWNTIESLNLSKNKIKTVPDEIDQYQELCVLDLSDNALEALPVNLGKLPKLSRLNISGNPINKMLPEELADLLVARKTIKEGQEVPKGLKLIISPDQKRFLPYKLTASLNIDIVTLPPQVNLDGQELKKLPSDLFEKTSLEHLSANNNCLDSLSEDIKKLTNLTKLSLANNNLTTLPEGLDALTKLINLNVSDNEFSTFPDQIFSLESLKTLNVSNNNFETLPDSLLRLDDLEVLNISGNPLNSIPDLSKCSKLKTLYISKNQESLITDEIKAKGIRVVVSN
jgi:Leucine-rich repeat (LRR) protein